MYVLPALSVVDELFPNLDAALAHPSTFLSVHTWQVHIGTFQAPQAFGQFWSDRGRYRWVRDLLG